MDAPLRIGVLGCGRIARAIHLPLLAGQPDVTIAAVADPDAEARAAGARRASGARAHADYQELIEAGGVDAVIVCLPTAQHADAATLAFARGLHVYLEKPLAATAEAAPGVLAAWRGAGTVGMIGFNFRFDPALLALRAALAREAAGDVVAVRTSFTVREAGLPPWKRTRAGGGGVLLDLASHHVDLVRFLFAREPRRVFCALRSVGSEDDTAALALWLDGGLLVQSFFSLCAEDDDVVHVHGRRGRLTARRHLSPGLEWLPAAADGARLRRLWNAARPLLRHPPRVDRVGRARWQASYRAALGHFVACARTGRPATPSLEDGWRSLAVIAAAEASARSGTIVDLPEVR